MSDYFLMRVHDLNVRAMAQAMYDDVPFCEVHITKEEKSPYLKEFRREHWVIPSIAGLKRIVRAFV